METGGWILLGIRAGMLLLKPKFLRSAAVRQIVSVSSASFGPNNLPKENFT